MGTFTAPTSATRAPSTSTLPRRQLSAAASQPAATASRRATKLPLRAITRLVERGELRVLRDRRAFTFKEVAAAHDYVASGHATGKVALDNN